MVRREHLNGRVPCPTCGHVAPRNGLQRICCDCEIETLFANWLCRLCRIADWCHLWRELMRPCLRSVPTCWPYPAFLTGPRAPEIVGITDEAAKRKERCPVCGQELMIPLGQPYKRCPSCGTMVGMCCPACGQESMTRPTTLFGQPYRRRRGKLLRCASCATLVGMWHFSRPRRVAVAAAAAGLADDSGPETCAQQSEHTAFYSDDDGDAAVWENGMTEHQTATANGRPSNVDGRLPSVERAKLREEIIYFQKCRRLHPRATEFFDRRRK